VRWRPTGRRRARRAKPRSNTCNMLLSPPGPSTSPKTTGGTIQPLLTSHTSYHDHPLHSGAPGPLVGDGRRAEPVLLAGSSRAAGVAHRVRSHTVSRPASPITLAHAHATCTCTYACAYVPIHVHAYVSLKQTRARSVTIPPCYKLKL
jgi:hypothetical protein